MTLKIGFWYMAILVIFGDKMFNLGPIDFKMDMNWHKIGQMPLWYVNIKFAYLVHFLSNFDVPFFNARILKTNRMVTAIFPFVQILVFAPFLIWGLIWAVLNQELTYWADINRECVVKAYLSYKLSRPKNNDYWPMG